MSQALAGQQPRAPAEWSIGTATAVASTMARRADRRQCAPRPGPRL